MVFLFVHIGQDTNGLTGLPILEGDEYMVNSGFLAHEIEGIEFFLCVLNKGAEDHAITIVKLDHCLSFGTF